MPLETRSGKDYLFRRDLVKITKASIKVVFANGIDLFEVVYPLIFSVS